ncbi:hypothetical protein BT93_J1185 [Corymbia citriodora subsp. variegata]|nr:hypothetical protein BT93_J1185 [Corymbia citriodora subsp. variegata]
MPVCDLDKRRPYAKKMMGLDGEWWDRNEGDWKVFDDSCPHRLAPLLQCVYHGWCFGGSGDRKIIPQAPPDGPPATLVHTFKKACVAVYSSTLQHNVLWFWPNSDPQYKDIIMKKKPPYIPELDDPSYSKLMGNGGIPYGYEVMVENLMDPAHVPYDHYGIMQTQQPKNRLRTFSPRLSNTSYALFTVKADREGGRPVDLSIKKLDVDGFLAKLEWGSSKFIPPCIFYANAEHLLDLGNGTAVSDGSKMVWNDIHGSSATVATHRMALIFICIPVSPGNSRLIWAFPRNFGVWIDQVVPQWIFHMRQNLILDSDFRLSFLLKIFTLSPKLLILLCLFSLRIRIMEVGSSNWQKACFVPTKSDALVVGFRKWLNKCAGGQVDSRASRLTGLSVASGNRRGSETKCVVGYSKNYNRGMAVLFFGASRWLAHFAHKNFWYHDYDHAFRQDLSSISPFSLPDLCGYSFCTKPNMAIYV